jgi:hypothetical protein
MKRLILFFVLMSLVVGIASAAVDITPDEIALGGPDQKKSNPDEDEEVTVTQTFSVENTGTETVDDVTVSSVGELAGRTGYNVMFSDDGATYVDTLQLGDMAAGAKEDVYVKVRVDEAHPATGMGEKIASIVVDGTSADLTLQVKNNLVFDRIYVQIGDESRKRYEDRDDIDDIMPGDEICIEVEVENTYSNRDDVEFEDVEVDIESDDSDFDADESLEDYGDIDAGDEESDEYCFTVDNDVDEDTYEVTFELDAKDEYGSRQGEIWTLEFEVEREDEDITIRSASIAQSVLKCRRDTTVSVRLENFGDDDSDEVVLQVMNEELDINRVFRNIRLDEEDSYLKTIPITVEDDAREGAYTLEVRSYFDEDDYEDEDYNDVDFLDLIVQACIEPIVCYSCEEGKLETMSVEALTCPDGMTRTAPTCVVPMEPAPDTPTGGAAAPVVRIAGRDDLVYVGLLALGWIIAIILIILLIGYLMRR